MAVTLFNLEEKITILQATVTEKINWLEQSLNMLIQTEFLILEEILEIVHVGETRFVVFVEDRKLRCLKCRKKSHIRVKCNAILLESHKEEEEKTATITAALIPTTIQEGSSSNNEEKGKIHILPLQNLSALRK